MDVVENDNNSERLEVRLGVVLVSIFYDYAVLLLVESLTLHLRSIGCCRCTSIAYRKLFHENGAARIQLRCGQIVDHFPMTNVMCEYVIR